MPHPAGAKEYESALKQVFASGIDVVVDYLWGESAKTVIVAIAKTADEAKPVRFVHVGGASREGSIELPGAALRASAIVLMGSGIGSVRASVLLQAIKSVFEAVQPAGLKIATKVVPFSEVEGVGTKPPANRVWSFPSGSPSMEDAPHTSGDRALVGSSALSSLQRKSAPTECCCRTGVSRRVSQRPRNVCCFDIHRVLGDPANMNCAQPPRFGLW